jgi:hypothetical protein
MDEMAQIHIASILTNDREAVKISNWWSQPFIGQARKDFQAEQAQSQQEEVATP